MKRKAEGEPGSPSTKKNLQFIGVNGGYVLVFEDHQSVIFYLYYVLELGKKGMS